MKKWLLSFRASRKSYMGLSWVVKFKVGSKLLEVYSNFGNSGIFIIATKEIFAVMVTLEKPNVVILGIKGADIKVSLI